MKAPCRIGLLGCGAVSELYYAPALQYLEAEGAAVLAAVYDPDAARAAKFCAKFPNAVVQADESFLQKVPLDLAIVASPVSSHEAHAIRAFEAGLAVLCEKPLAGDTGAGERMIAAARRHQRMLAVGLLRRKDVFRNFLDCGTEFGTIAGLQSEPGCFRPLVNVGIGIDRAALRRSTLSGEAAKIVHAAVGFQ